MENNRFETTYLDKLFQIIESFSNQRENEVNQIKQELELSLYNLGLSEENFNQLLSKYTDKTKEEEFEEEVNLTSLLSFHQCNLLRLNEDFLLSSEQKQEILENYTDQFISILFFKKTETVEKLKLYKDDLIKIYLHPEETIEQYSSIFGLPQQDATESLRLELPSDIATDSSFLSSPYSIADRRKHLLSVEVDSYNASSSNITSARERVSVAIEFGININNLDPKTPQSDNSEIVASLEGLESSHFILDSSL